VTMNFVGTPQRISVQAWNKEVAPPQLADPTTLACTVQDPQGNQITYTLAASQIVRDGVGLYHLDVTPTIPGGWQSWWVAGGALVATAPFLFQVAPDPLTPS